MLNRTWKVVKLPPAVALGHHLGANVGSGLGHGLLPVDVGRVEGGRGEVMLRCHQVEAARGSDDRSRRDLKNSITCLLDNLLNSLEPTILGNIPGLKASL